MAFGFELIIGAALAIILSIIGLFFGNIILFDSLALAIASGFAAHGLLHIHPALSIIIGIVVLVVLYWLQNTKVGFWIIGGTATYDSVNRTAVARNDLDTICFPIDTHKYFDFRGSADWSNYQPEIHNDHVYVPVTVINAFVDASKTIYDEKNNMIKFYSVK